METREELIKSKIDNWHFSNGQTLLSLEVVSELMTTYAKKVAGKALNDAAENHFSDNSVYFGCENEIERILSTPIVTP